MIDTSFFRFFFVKKGQKMRFQTDFQGKLNIIVRQFSQSVTFSNLGTACPFNQSSVKKRTKREILCQFSGKDPYNRTTIFPKRNGFFMIDRSFFLDICGKKVDN